LQCATRPFSYVSTSLAAPSQAALAPWRASHVSISPCCCAHAAPVSDEAPESLGVKEDGTPTGWITTATAVRILDDIARCEQVILVTRLCLYSRSAAVYIHSGSCDTREMTSTPSGRS
jgi:hypothetical protein